jgi:23S rRNA pseudouridine955/2504/2580 synthase
MLFAKSLKGAQAASSILRSGKAEKYYTGILDGAIANHETWQDSLARDPAEMRSFSPHEGARIGKGRIGKGRPAVTEIFPIESAAHATLVLMRIQTGRTHQIRAQAALHFHPLSGDAKYGGSAFLPRYLLHAIAIRIKEPTFPLDFPSLTAGLSEEARTIIQTLFGEAGLRGIEAQLDQFEISMRLTRD